MVESLGDEEFAKWPLHITVVPWFQCELSEEELIDWCSRVLQNARRLELEVGAQTMFRGRIPMHLLIENEGKRKLIHLHQKLIETMGERGFELVNDNYVGRQYKPHITVRGDRSIEPGKMIQVEGLTLVRSVSEQPKVRQKVTDIQLFTDF
ncbi:MAG: 2'-5' RNA ligase family protein [Candidatus Saccharimonadales bacterium]|nr:2'-5' RNA ligase family protein [Candidatus Saccharimonadales bacterium]